MFVTTKKEFAKQNMIEKAIKIKKLCTQCFLL